MPNSRSVAWMIALTAVCATQSSAGTVTFVGTGFTIQDNASVSSDIIVGNVGSIAGSVQVTLIGLQHSFVGDLVVTLTHLESGTSIDLFNRVGRVGGTGSGDSANLSGSYTFAGGASGDLWGQALSSTDTAFVIPGGSYFPTTVDGVPTSFGLFIGLGMGGTWRLTISDLANGDTGSLTGWQLSADVAVPEPSSAVTLLFGLILAALRMKRRCPHSEESYR